MCEKIGKYGYWEIIWEHCKMCGVKGDNGVTVMDTDTSESTSSTTTTVSSRIKDAGPKFLKLFFVLSCYTCLFYVIVRQARWFLRGWESDAPEIDLIGWLKCLPNCSPSAEDVTKKLVWNVLMFLVFVAQHSLLAERNLSGTLIHRKLFIDWKVNGALYTLATAIALHIHMTYWNVVPVYLWKLPILQPICNVVHFIAWLSLYGTTLMQDMPELVGLNQVVFTNNSTNIKSEKFKAMLRRQRHLGFVPFAVLILVCRVMTLDRFLYLIVLGLYSYKMWQDPDSYEYIKEMTRHKRTCLISDKKMD